MNPIVRAGDNGEGSIILKTTRQHSDRGRRYRRDAISRDGRAHAVRVSRGRDEIVLEVHVHNEMPAQDGAVVRTSTRPSYIPPDRRSGPGFSGTLYSWREHYHPIFKKIVPLVADKAAREKRFLARLARLSLWAAVLAALTTVGCEYFRP